MTKLFQLITGSRILQFRYGWS